MQNRVLISGFCHRHFGQPAEDTIALEMLKESGSNAELQRAAEVGPRVLYSYIVVANGQLATCISNFQLKAQKTTFFSFQKNRDSN